MGRRSKKQVAGRKNQAAVARKKEEAAEQAAQQAAAIDSCTPRCSRGRGPPAGDARALGRGPSPGADSVDPECGCDV